MPDLCELGEHICLEDVRVAQVLLFSISRVVARIRKAGRGVATVRLFPQ